MIRRRALLLDRDGVINVDAGYVFQREEFKFIDGIFDLVAVATAKEYLVVVITNQSGIGRGYYSEAEFSALMDWVGAQFRRHGGRIDRVYFCPYHPVHGVGDYKRDSPLRKPAPGMILAAANDLNLDLERSVLVGDKESDIAAGCGAGVGRNILYSPTGVKRGTDARCLTVRELNEVAAML